MGVSSQTSPLLVLQPAGRTRSRLIRRAKTLSLLSILANAAVGWWWLDPIAGLGIAGLAVREGRAAWAGEVCADCTPIGCESAESCGEEQ